MRLSWSGRRQLLYYGVGIIVLLVLAWATWAAFFNTPPSCFNNVQDGTETGVDCGGNVCTLLCSNTAREPVALWSRAFNTGGNYYTAAAYIQNSNQGAGAKSVHYAFQLFDDNNSLIIEKDGTANLGPVNIVPIIEPNINVGNRVVSRTLFSFTDSNFVWNKISTTTYPLMHITQQNLNSDASQLSAQLNNPTLIDVKNVSVVAVLFDDQGVARAASKSLLQNVPRKSSEPIVFTWPGGVANIVRAEITVLPAF